MSPFFPFTSTPLHFLKCLYLDPRLFSLCSSYSLPHPAGGRGKGAAGSTPQASFGGRELRGDDQRQSGKGEFLRSLTDS